MSLYKRLHEVQGGGAATAPGGKRRDPFPDGVPWTSCRRL